MQNYDASLTQRQLYTQFHDSHMLAAIFNCPSCGNATCRYNDSLRYLMTCARSPSATRPCQIRLIIATTTTETAQCNKPSFFQEAAVRLDLMAVCAGQHEHFQGDPWSSPIDVQPGMIRVMSETEGVSDLQVIARQRKIFE